MAQALINIDGVVKDVADVTQPTTGREFRGAWQWNGTVIEVDMIVAREIKIEKIWQKAQERITKAEEQAAKKAIKGEDTTVEESEAAKFKSKPKQAAIDLIANAATPEELNLITEDEIYN